MKRLCDTNSSKHEHSSGGSDIVFIWYLICAPGRSVGSVFLDQILFNGR